MPDDQAEAYFNLNCPIRAGNRGNWGRGQHNPRIIHILTTSKDGSLDASPDSSEPLGSERFVTNLPHSSEPGHTTINGYETYVYDKKVINYMSLVSPIVSMFAA